MSSDSLMKSAGIVAMGTMLSKILGFLRETAMASHFGATYATDAYLMAMVIPSMLLLGIGPAVTTTLIPVFADIEKRKGRAAAFASINNIVNACLLVSVGVAVVGIAASDPIVRVVAPGFSGETLALTIELTRILFPIAVFLTMSSVLTGLLQSLGKFGAPAFTGIAQNIVIISSIVFFGPKYGIGAVAVGTVLGAASMLAVQIPALRFAGYRYHPSMDWHDEGLRQVGRLILPIVAGSAAGQAGVMIMRILASSLPEGSVAYLNYSDRLIALPSGIFGTALITVLYPTLARMHSSGSKDEFVRTFERSVGVVSFMLIPMAAGMAILATPIVRLAFERGAFTREATNATAAALVCSAIAIPATSLSELATKTFYASHDTLTPVFVNIGAIGVAVVLRFFLVGKMGHAGLALAGACQPIASFSMLYIILRRRMRSAAGANADVGAGTRVHAGSAVDTGAGACAGAGDGAGADGYSLAGSITKSVVSAAAMWAVVAPVDRWVTAAVPGAGVVHQATRLAISVGMGVIVYFGMAVLLRSEELSFLAGVAKKRAAARG